MGGSVEREELWSTIEAERHRFADLLEGLPLEQWDEPSWCRGWRLRDVAAHVTLSTRAQPLEALAGLVRARGSFNGFVMADARSRSGRPPAVLVAELRAVAASRHHPIGTRPEDPLVDVLVHAQDVARPLGLDHQMPIDAAVAAADRVWSMSFPFHARRRTGGVRVRAMNAEWSRGPAGAPEAIGTIAEILLVLTGRSIAVNRLQGPGAAALALPGA